MILGEIQIRLRRRRVLIEIIRDLMSVQDAKIVKVTDIHGVFILQASLNIGHAVYEPIVARPSGMSPTLNADIDALMAKGILKRFSWGVRWGSAEIAQAVESFPFSRHYLHIVNDFVSGREPLWDELRAQSIPEQHIFTRPYPKVVELFFNEMWRKGVDAVCDVRGSVSGLRYASNASQVGMFLGMTRVAYPYFRSLTETKELRQQAKSFDDESMMEIYHQWAKGKQVREALDSLKVRLGQDKRVCLLGSGSLSSSPHRKYVAHVLLEELGWTNYLLDCA